MTTETRVSIAVALPVATSAIPVFGDKGDPIVSFRLRMRHVTEISVFVDVALPVAMGDRNCTEPVDTAPQVWCTEPVDMLDKDHSARPFGCRGP